MTSLEIMIELETLPAHFWNTEAVIAVDQKEKRLFITIEELAPRGVGSDDDEWFSDPDLYQLRCWGIKTEDCYAKSLSEEIAKERAKIIDSILSIS